MSAKSGRLQLRDGLSVLFNARDCVRKRTLEAQHRHKQHPSAEKEAKKMNVLLNKSGIEEVGKESLVRLLIVYPWTQKYFDDLGDLSSVEAIQKNPKVAAHGEKILKSVEEAMKHLDNLNHQVEQSQYYTKELHIDPSIFPLYTKTLTDVMADQFKGEFPSEVRASFEKTFSAMNDAVSKAVSE
ncbi:hypothetical protein GDO81_017014 [Engystomops pustulosus]|uniref:Globin domain-containing protein n=1 Tax=Engystomops pustulosus TaxID=76066 RepID=A0AAV7AG63_ENGPU|nr:hypothetical protein GDO81_017014 [Engystomops pustulosus]